MLLVFMVKSTHNVDILNVALKPSVIPVKRFATAIGLLRPTILDTNDHTVKDAIDC